MKKLAVTLCLAALATSTFAQGLVKFSNTAATLVSYGPQGGASSVMPNSASGTYYFGLLIAPAGTTDPLAFSFASLYATNSAATTGGRFQGGLSTGVAVPGWAGGETRAYEIAGWSSDLGATFQSSWLTTAFQQSHAGFFGFSGIGTGFAGGTDSLGNSLPPLVLIGASPAIGSGWTLTSVPEPTTMALAGLGAAALMIFRRRK